MCVCVFPGFEACLGCCIGRRDMAPEPLNASFQFLPDVNGRQRVQKWSTYGSWYVQRPMDDRNTFPDLKVLSSLGGRILMDQAGSCRGIKTTKKDIPGKGAANKRLMTMAHVVQIGPPPPPKLGGFPLDNDHARPLRFGFKKPTPLHGQHLTFQPPFV